MSRLVQAILHEHLRALGEVRRRPLRAGPRSARGDDFPLVRVRGRQATSYSRAASRASVVSGSAARSVARRVHKNRLRVHDQPRRRSSRRTFAAARLRRVGRSAIRPGAHRTAGSLRARSASLTRASRRRAYCARGRRTIRETCAAMLSGCPPCSTSGRFASARGRRSQAHRPMRPPTRLCVREGIPSRRRRHAQAAPPGAGGLDLAASSGRPLLGRRHPAISVCRGGLARM